MSLIQESVSKDLATKKELPLTGISLVSAAGEDIPALGCATVILSVVTLKVTHPLIIVPTLIAQVNIGFRFPAKARISLRLHSESSQNSVMYEPPKYV